VVGPLRIELLGGLRVETGEGRSITRFSTRQAASLLAYLAFYRHQAHPREILCEML
jgi:DNA-binding SARP family transcriptional activator